MNTTLNNLLLLSFFTISVLFQTCSLLDKKDKHYYLPEDQKCSLIKGEILH